MTDRASAEALRALADTPLAVQPPSAPSLGGLDVGRLEDAMYAVGETNGADPATPMLYPSDAQAIAAEYERLAEGAND